MTARTVSPEIVGFLPETPFVESNRDAITGVFADFAQDFPDRTVIVDEQAYPTAEALQFDSNGDPTLAARRWLWTYAMGTQHGYDRGKGGKVYIEHGDPKYMAHAAKLQSGAYNFVTGGKADGAITGRNLLIGGGFPHLNSGRLRVAVDGDYEALAEVNTVAILGGQRRRWNDNYNEATGDVVLQSIAETSNLDPHESEASRKRLEFWHETSRFAIAEAAKPEGPAWTQRYATEAHMGRTALEFALLQSGELFDWKEYPVIEHIDETAESIPYEGGIIPARHVRAWEYQLTNGHSFYVANGKAVARAPGSEPRPTSYSVMSEAYSILANDLHTHENVIGFGAPHIRAGYDTAIGLMALTGGDIAPIHLSMDKWERHEPPISGLTIVDMYKADMRLRAIVAGKDPNAPALVNL
jgi:hypothetical protein